MSLGSFPSHTPSHFPGPLGVPVSLPGTPITSPVVSTPHFGLLLTLPHHPVSRAIVPSFS